MEMETLLRKVAIVVILLFCAIVIIALVAGVFGGEGLRRFVASIFFWIPFGSIYTALMQGLAAIPG